MCLGVTLGVTTCVTQGYNGYAMRFQDKIIFSVGEWLKEKKELNALDIIIITDFRAKGDL